LDKHKDELRDEEIGEEENKAEKSDFVPKTPSNKPYEIIRDNNNNNDNNFNMNYNGESSDENHQNDEYGNVLITNDYNGLYDDEGNQVVVVDYQEIEDRVTPEEACNIM